MLKPRSELTLGILRALRSEQPGDAWHLVPWNIWVPALTLLLAISFVAIALPPQAQIAVPIMRQISGTDSETITHSIQFGRWITSNSEADPFLPLWAGLLILLSGFGLILSVSSWGASTNKQFERFEARVTNVAQRFRQGLTWNKQ